jgi:NAD(P)H-nitrite reductase large subunit
MKRDFTEDILAAPDDEIVCWCSMVSKGTILKAIRAGAVTLEHIRGETRACTLGRCKVLSPRGRCCSIEIKQLLKAELS